MRILLYTYAFPPSIGGVERQTAILARELSSRGHTVRVLTARVPGTTRYERVDGYEVQRIDPGSGSRWRSMSTWLTRLIRIGTPLVAWADVVHAQQMLYPAAALAVVCWVLRRPLVVTNTGSGHFGAVAEMSRLPFGHLALNLIRLAPVCVSLSTEMTTEMRGAGLSRIQQIPNGVEIPNQVVDRRGELSSELPVVVYTGRLSEEKGVETLVRAWALLTLSARLVIVGDGPQRRDLERLVDPGTPNPVDFVGAHADVRPFLQMADVFVLPSRSEGISVALLEAMAHGVPVIATDVGGNREVLKVPGTGILVPPNDPQQMASALTSLLSSPVARARLAKAGRMHVAAHYAIPEVVDAYERVYQAF